ncbi:hypothetical protein P7C71_g3672, partial [Lecanoromycetidae sp. Uapishka_2]
MMQAMGEQSKGRDVGNVSRIDFAPGGLMTPVTRVDENGSHGGIEKGESGRGTNAHDHDVEPRNSTTHVDSGDKGQSSHTNDADRSDVTEGGMLNSGDLSTEETDVENIGHSNDNGAILPFLYVRTLPELQYYDQPLHMTIQSLMTQEEYTEALKAKFRKHGFEGNTVDRNETILVVCTHKGQDHHFQVPRITLERSPFLYRTFASDDFVQGSETAIHFLEDPARCFRAVQRYLEDGPDNFNAEELKKFVTYDGNIKSSNTETIELLVRLHKLAHKLAMRSFWRMTIDVLHDLEEKVDASCCMNVAKLVFGEGFFKVAIVNFAIKHICQQFRALNETPTWHEVLEIYKHSKLGDIWAALVLTHHSSGPAIVGQTGTVIPSVVVHPPYNPTPPVELEANNPVNTNNYEQDEDDEDDESITDPSRRSGSMEKVREMLGGLPTDVPAGTSYDTAESYARRTSIDPNYKARKVLGMNSDGGGKIAGRRKQSIAQKASIRAAKAAEKGVKKVLG